MLFDKEKFDKVESFLTKNGTVERFEKENGRIKGRMMIDRIDPPNELNIQIPKGAYSFGASFDFYDCSLGIVLDSVKKTACSGLWITEQKGDAEHPSQEWIEFFIKTLLNSIDVDGSFGYPMFTFVTDDADMTVVPTQE